MMAARDQRGRPGAPWDTLSRKVLAAMIVTGGLLTLVSFAKYVPGGAVLTGIVNSVQHLVAPKGDSGNTAR
jgi:hypothetical protein